MFRTIVRSCVCLLPLLLLAACQEKPAVTAPEILSGSPGKAGGHSGWCDVAFHDQLENIWNNDAGIQWETVQWTIDCSQPASVVATPAGWPAGYEVRLEIPAGAVPPTQPGYPFVEFAIDVPATGPVGARDSVPYEFHPDGIEFQKAINVTVCWPPWADVPAGAAYDLVHLVLEDHDGQPHYSVTDWHPAWPQGVKNQTDAKAGGSWSTGIEASVSHFSRWDLVNGDDGDGGDKAGGLPNLTGASCWQELPDDPLAKATALR